LVIDFNISLGIRIPICSTYSQFVVVPSDTFCMKLSQSQIAARAIPR
jgi:hypothetical protein